MKLKSTLKLLIISGVCCTIVDRAILAYIHQNFSNEEEYKKTEVLKYPILHSSLALDNSQSGLGVFSGPMFDIKGKPVGGIRGFGKSDSPILSYEECINKGSNFNLDSLTYIMCIDTITCKTNMFPSYDSNYGDMAYRYANDEEYARNKIILQNGNYLMIKGGISPLHIRHQHDNTKTLRVAFGTDGDGNYVFVKYFGTLRGLQEYLKKTFGRDNPEFIRTHAAKYTQAAFLYMDGNNIVFDGKYYIARRKSFFNDKIGIVKLAKLIYLKNVKHLEVKQKSK